MELVRPAAGTVNRHVKCRTNRMTSRASSKFVSRMFAVLFIGLAFAGCAAMFVQGEKSLFVESSSAAMAP